MSAARPVRVLWLIRGLGPGGAEFLLVAHARAAGEGFSYEVAYQRPDKDQLVPDLEDAGVVVHRIGSGASWPMELRKLVADREIDVVHAHSPAMAVGARLALRALPGGRRPALVYTEHNRWEAYRLPTRLANAATYPLDHEILAVSDEARSSVVGPLRSRVETLHHGIDRDALRASAAARATTRASLGIDEEAFVAVQVANFRREKAHEVLVDAGAQLRGGARPIHVLMVGQGPLQGEVVERIERAGVGDVISVLGFRTDVASIVAASDVLVLSSDHEGLPVAVMESLSLGIPVVATAVGGIPEAITDEVEGLLVPPRSPDALAAALRRAAGDPALCARLGSAARERSAQFDAVVATRRVEELYRAGIARR